MQAFVLAGKMSLPELTLHNRLRNAMNRMQQDDLDERAKRGRQS